jgi:hypothetical protein
MTRVTDFLETKLRLRVNRDKSAVAPVVERKFLAIGFCPAGNWGSLLSRSTAPRSGFGKSPDATGA